MNSELNDLVAVLEEEIVVGEQLCRGLATQRQALVAWDMEALLTGIEAREPLLRTLGELERRRLKILEHRSRAQQSVTLSHLIGECCDVAKERQRLHSVRARARKTFSRLQADERSLNGLMENLLVHLHEALSPLARPTVALYGDTGAAAAQRPSSALIRNKA
jgi:flagellar biosynthesis/type III secretory pathway chaperone